MKVYRGTKTAVGARKKLFPCPTPLTSSRARAMAIAAIQAETALVMRAQDLSSGDKFEEEESLHDAICILHARRSSLKHSPSAGQRQLSLNT